MKVVFELIRHGQTPANEMHCYLGKTQEGLSDKGRQQVQILQEKHVLLPPDCLLISPMTRCQETANILFPTTTPIIVSGFSEMDFGIFEQKTYMELKDNTIYQNWLDSMCEMKIPEGESKKEFVARVIFAYEKQKQNILKNYVDFINPVFSFVVHGGTIMALMSSWTHEDYFDFQAENANGYHCELEIDERSTRLLQYRMIIDRQ